MITLIPILVCSETFKGVCVCGWEMRGARNAYWSFKVRSVIYEFQNRIQKFCILLGVKKIETI